MTTTNLPMRSYRARKRINTPTSMEPSPAMRNSRSPTSSSRAKARFTPRGFKNGAMPSNTRNRPNAASRSDELTPRASLGPAALIRVLQVLEELPVGREHQEVAVLAEGALVGLQAPIEGVELGVLGIGARIDRSRRRISLAADAQRIALGVGEDLGATPVGARLDAVLAALAFGTQSPRRTREALLHALVDPRRHIVGEIDALHAHVDQL